MKHKSKTDLLQEIERLQRRIAELEAKGGAPDITERMRTEEEASRMVTVVRDSNDAITIQDFEGHILAWNRGAELMYGYSEEEALQKNIWLLTPSNRAEEQKDFTRRLIAGEKITSFETQRVTKDGRILDIWLIVTKLMDAAGKVIGIASTERDITERRRAEKELQAANQQLAASNQQLRAMEPQLRASNQQLEASEIFLASVIEQNPSSTWISDGKGTLVRMNRACRELFGVTEAEVVGKYNILKDNLVEAQGHMPLVRDVFEKGTVARFTLDYDARDVKHIDVKAGKRRILDVVVSPIRDALGNVTNAIVQHKDVTELKRAEEALRESEAKFRDTVQYLDEGYYSVTLDGTLLAHNIAFNRILGIDPQRDMKGARLPDFWQNPEDRKEYLKEFMAKGFINNYQINAKTIDGKPIFVIANAHLVKDENGKPARIDGTFIDITLRKQAEDALQKSEEKYRSLFENAQIGMYRSKIDGSAFLDVNKKFAEILGFLREELLGTEGRIRWADQDDRDRMMKRLKDQGGILTDFETKVLGKHQEIIDVLASIELHLGEGFLTGTMMDITARKRAEEEIRIRNRIAEIFLSVPDDEMYYQVMQVFRAAMKSEFATFGYIDEEGALVVPTMTRHVWDRCQIDDKDVVFPRKTWGQSSWPRCLKEKKAVALNEPSKLTPKGHIPITRHISQPIVHQGKAIGIMQVANKPSDYDENDVRMIQIISDAIAPVLNARLQRDRATNELIKHRDHLEELVRERTADLQAANEELEEQTQRLQESEERLKTQQEELEVTNEELEEKNDLLDRQKREVERARKDVEEKAAEVALASKYKSEFLANMSHELRSPLNSLLLLSQGLAENRNGNLSPEQIESAKIIHGSGSDLLNLINEILDLSRIEAGRIDLRFGAVRVADLADAVRATFGHMAKEKGLTLEVAVRDDAPPRITSDRKRVEQIVRNLLSNALKFTEQGSVTVTFGPGISDFGFGISDCQSPASGRSVGTPVSSIPQSAIVNPQSREMLCISVADTGIGIGPDQQKIIFEAFQQADGGTSRKYGGTGLGLSISQELARLLGGEIRLESEPGKGSTFTLSLPVEPLPTADRRSPTGPGKAGGQGRVAVPTERGARSPIGNRPSAIPDDRDGIAESDRVILIVEDDPDFAKVLREKCHDKGFKCIAASTGEEGLELAASRLPGAVILDVRLPGLDGWSVLGALKDNTRTRHIPVHVISVEEDAAVSLRLGAVGHAVKPVTQEDLEAALGRLEQVASSKPRRVLVVEDDAKIRVATVKLIGNGDVKVDQAATGAEALAALRAGGYDCVVLDLGLPDMDGNELLATLEREGVELPPVVVHTARDLTREQEEALRERAESIVIKDVRSRERLLDEVSLFLHRVVKNMPEKKQKIIRDLHDTDEALRDRKVLIVDDDMRTVFAMSRLLADRGMKPLKAENGERALRLLEEHPDVALVLMDIMMPVMDGYEAIRQVRNPHSAIRNHKVPIIALTAKAMPEDREKCLAAGANDYMTKPVEEKRLISMMRVWMHR